MDNTVSVSHSPAPLGYVFAPAYLHRCALRNEADPQRRFTLDFALQHWDRDIAPGWLLDRLGPAPRCLIQGSASPDNVEALAAFLARHSIFAPRIHVMDLIDIEALGYGDPRAVYHRANAADLSATFDEDAFDCILQDHLLNCAPIALCGPILGEMQRILRPGGIALVHYTDSSSFPAARGAALAPYLQSTDKAYYLDLPAALESTFTSLPVEQRLIETAEGYVLATVPFGNLEHYLPFAAFAARMAEAGLVLERHKQLHIVDGEGLDCRRNHCIATPRHR